MTETYAPFPHAEMEALAANYEEVASKFPVASPLSKFYSTRAEMLRNALACHVALRDRFLEDTAAHRGALGRLQVRP